MSKTKQKLDQNTIHRVLKLIRPYAGMVILTLTLALITVVTTCWPRYCPARPWI